MSYSRRFINCVSAFSLKVFVIFQSKCMRLCRFIFVDVYLEYVHNYAYYHQLQREIISKYLNYLLMLKKDSIKSEIIYIPKILEKNKIKTLFFDVKRD